MNVFDVSVRDILMENVEDKNNGADEEAVKLMKTIRKKQKPRFKLDVQRLIGDSGLLQLDKELNNIVFKGKKHEKEDLKLLMNTYEIWAHQLASVMSFNDCIDKFEDLGHKMEVRSMMRQYRNRGLTSEFVTDDHLDDLDDNIEKINENNQSTNFGDNFEDEDFHFDDDMPVAPEIGQILQEEPDIPEFPVVETLGERTPEEKQRIEENRIRALERLKASRERQAQMSQIQ